MLATCGASTHPENIWRKALENTSGVSRLKNHPRGSPALRSSRWKAAISPELEDRNSMNSNPRTTSFPSVVVIYYLSMEKKNQDSAVTREVIL